MSGKGKEGRVPQIRFAGFTDPWEQRKFSDLVEVCSGRDYKHLHEGAVPVYGTGGYMTSVDEALSYDKDAIGIGRKGTIDKPYRLRAPFWTVDTLFYCIPYPGIDINFALCCFSNVDWKNKDESTGLPSLSKEAINEAFVCLPSADEQIAIGHHFTNLDNLITLHQRKYDKLCAVKKSMLDKMFPKGGSLYPEIRFAGFTDPWEQRKLGDVGYATSGIGFPDAEQGGKEGIPFFKVSDMNLPENSRELVTSNNYVTESQIAANGWHPIANLPAIFFAKVGAAVYLNRKRLVDTPFLLDNNTMAFSLDTEKISSSFAQSLFEGIDLTALTQVGALPSLNAADIESLETLMPLDMGEQVKIGRYFANLDSLITLHQRKLELLRNIKKAMLDKMFA
ncbi:restriction endonuclease subunit S [Bifidobacteriaceae bacterium MCC02031]|nr:restriction endonuclease subunit S [Bifidobacteriaceae bacterium MCC02031]